MSKNIILNSDYNVLIVEDEPILAMAMESKLKKIGLKDVGIATTPDKAILYSQNNFPDIAIIDINLNSSKNGIDVANHMWRNLNIPIIFLTSYYNEKILNQAMECEPYAYLLKPCRYKELEAALNMALYKHQFFFKNKKNLSPIEQNFIEITDAIKYDKIESQLYVNDTLFKLTTNEKKLFQILTKDINNIVSFDVIFSFIWREDVYDLSKLRSLIYRLKLKLDYNPFESFYQNGYKIKVLKKSV